MKPRCNLVGVEKALPFRPEGGTLPYQSYIGLLAEGSPRPSAPKTTPSAGTGSHKAPLRAGLKIRGLTTHNSSSSGSLTAVGYMIGQRRGRFMKLAPIASGLLAAASLASPAFARGALHLLDPAWNPEHIRGLPAEVRNALAHMCGDPQAEH